MSNNIIIILIIVIYKALSFYQTNMSLYNNSCHKIFKLVKLSSSLHNLLHICTMIFRALALENANAKSKDNLAF